MTWGEKKYWGKSILLCGAIMLLLVGLGCALVFGLAKVGGPNEPIGEKFDDPAYAVDGGSYFAKRYVASTRNGKTTINSGYFNGVRDVTGFSTKEGESVEISHAQTVTEGRVKLVAVLSDDTVIDLSAEDSPYTLHAPPGKTDLRIVGDGAKFKLEIEITD